MKRDMAFLVLVLHPRVVLYDSDTYDSDLNSGEFS
jgi:hypothetical protein